MTGRASGKRVGTILIYSGLAFGIIGAVATVVLGEIWPLAIIAIGFSDMFIGMLFRSGRIGQTADAEAGAEEFSDEDFGVSSSENPYVRED